MLTAQIRLGSTILAQMVIIVDTALSLNESFDQFQTFISHDLSNDCDIKSDIKVVWEQFILFVSDTVLSYSKQWNDHLFQHQNLKTRIESISNILSDLDIQQEYERGGYKQLGNQLVGVMDLCLALASDIERYSGLNINPNITQELHQRASTLKGYGKIFIGFNNLSEIKTPNFPRINVLTNLFSDFWRDIIKGLERVVEPLNEGIMLAKDDCSSKILVQIERYLEKVLDLCKTLNRKIPNKSKKGFNSLYILALETLNEIDVAIQQKDLHSIQIQRLFQRSPEEVKANNDKIQNWVKKQLANIEEDGVFIYNCEQPGQDIAIATTNIKHLSRFSKARNWNDI